jgi:hypothetical protein
LAQKYTVDEKIHHFSDTLLSKMPLRLLARELVLPPYIYLRKKIKMTEGVTTKKNVESDDGYLESYTKKTLDKTFREYVHEQYINYEYNLLSQESYLGTEEDAMRQVEEMKKQNKEAEEFFYL